MLLYSTTMKSTPQKTKKTGVGGCIEIVKGEPARIFQAYFYYTTQWDCHCIQRFLALTSNFLQQRARTDRVVRLPHLDKAKVEINAAPNAESTASRETGNTMDYKQDFLLSTVVPSMMFLLVCNKGVEICLKPKDLSQEISTVVDVFIFLALHICHIVCFPD